MAISIEGIIFIARKSDQHNKYGDPYDTVCTLIKVDDETLLVKGLVGSMNKSDFKELMEKIKGIGFSKIIWERKKDGKEENNGDGKIR